MDRDVAMIYLAAMCLVLAVLVIRLAREYEALYTEWSISEIENLALFKELENGRSTTA